MRTSPLGPATTSYGTIVSSSLTSASLRPMKRLIEKIVFSGFITAWRLATVPTSRSPLSVNATTDGVVRPPSAFSKTVGSPPSITATHELVVPRSIPIVFATFPPTSTWVGLFKLLKSKWQYGRSPNTFKGTFSAERFIWAADGLGIGEAGGRPEPDRGGRS